QLLAREARDESRRDDEDEENDQADRDEQQVLGARFEMDAAGRGGGHHSSVSSASCAAGASPAAPSSPSAGTAASAAGTSSSTLISRTSTFSVRSPSRTRSTRWVRPDLRNTFWNSSRSRVIGVASVLWPYTIAGSLPSRSIRRERLPRGWRGEAFSCMAVPLMGE